MRPLPACLAAFIALAACTDPYPVAPDLAASGADNWEDKSYLLYYKDAPWWEDGQEVALPEDFYSSEFIVDKMIEYLGETDPDKPFLAYLPFQAIHIPVQAPQEFIDNYDGVYDAGWDVLREARYERAQELGLVPEGVPLAPMVEGSRRWSELSDQDRELYAARMEVNAAMLEAMDFHIGRFMDHLKEQGSYENTIFVVTSDNGPENSSGKTDWRLTLWFRLSGYHIGLDGIGQAGSWGFIGPEWAEAAASPGAMFKFYATEGGVRVPLIIAGPGLERSRVDSPAMVSDIAPTLLEWVDAAPAPDNARPITGRSLLPVLRGEVDSVYAPDDVRAIEVSGNSALYKGDLKITRSMPPVGDAKWRLYDMRNDPGESRDLSQERPELLDEMLAEWAQYESEFGVLPMPEGYNSLEQILKNSTERFISNYRGVLIVGALVFLALLYGLWRAIRAIWRRAFS